MEIPPRPKIDLGLAIVKAMEEETRRIVEEEAKAAAKRVEDRVRGLVGQIATRVSSLVQYEMIGTSLRITVSLPDRNE